jgi:glycosyltransferase involved in cell wall biosynthesis
MKPLNIMHVTPTVSRLAGGLFESVRRLSQETQLNGLQVEVVGLHDAFAEEDIKRWAPLPIRTFPIVGPKALGYSPELSVYLQESTADIVHLHGVWQYPTAAVLRWARATGKPYMVSPHGMLEPWALRRSRFKKAVVNWLYQNACLRQAACLRATAASEVESIRLLGLKNPIALIPNGVPVPETLAAPSAIRHPPFQKRALFLSRIHPKKGLLDLVQAWAAIRQTDAGRRLTADWEVVLIGPDEGGHLAEVLRAVLAAGLTDHIRHGGECWDEAAKFNCYFAADLFVLPSYSENFGLVIAEALGCGVPVITTRATPWSDLEIHRCGWWIETGKAPLIAALQQALAVPLPELRAMGLRGRTLVRDKYAWAPIGRQMALTYEWLAGRQPRPDFIV